MAKQHGSNETDKCEKALKKWNNLDGRTVSEKIVKPQAQANESEQKSQTQRGTTKENRNLQHNTKPQHK